MILSQKHRFIFIKTNKTAGTSVEIALSRQCGEGDIITPLLQEDEALRREGGGRRPQHMKAPKGCDGPHRFAKLKNGDKVMLRFFNHMAASELLTVIKPAVWDDYFTFCVERNPWDRVASYYHYGAAHEDDPCDFTTFLLGDSLPFLKWLGRDLSTIDGKVTVDKVCSYENLEEDLREVFEAVGIDARVNLPRAKSGFLPGG